MLTRAFRHPVAGEITLGCDSLALTDRDQHLVLHSATPGSPRDGALSLLHVLGAEAGGYPQWRTTICVVAKKIDDALFAPIREARIKASGNQLGNPRSAAEALLDILDVPEPPAHLVLGSDALRLVTAARQAVDDDIRTWEKLSRTTDFPDGTQLKG